MAQEERERKGGGIVGGKGIEMERDREEQGEEKGGKWGKKS